MSTQSTLQTNSLDQTQRKQHTYNIIVLRTGGKQCGAKSLINRLVNNNDLNHVFIEENIAGTIIPFQKTTLLATNPDGNPIYSQLKIFCFERQYLNFMPNEFWKSIDGVMIVFNITNSATAFNKLIIMKKELDRCINESNPSIPMVIAGTKKDTLKEVSAELRQNGCPGIFTHQSQVRNWCVSEGRCMPFINTSAKMGMNVHFAFYAIAQMIYKRENQIVGGLEWKANCPEGETGQDEISLKIDVNQYMASMYE
jgi:hypothetical protein